MTLPTKVLDQLAEAIGSMIDDLEIELPDRALAIKECVEAIDEASKTPQLLDRVRITAGEFSPWTGQLVERESPSVFLVRMDPAPGSHHVTGPTVRVNRIEIEVIE